MGSDPKMANDCDGKDLWPHFTSKLRSLPVTLRANSITLHRKKCGVLINDSKEEKKTCYE